MIGHSYDESAERTVAKALHSIPLARGATSMPTNTPIVKKPEAATSVVARPETPTLDQVISAIAIDASSAPETYLRETEVPHGGE